MLANRCLSSRKNSNAAIRDGNRVPGSARSLYYVSNFRLGKWVELLCGYKASYISLATFVISFVHMK